MSGYRAERAILVAPCLALGIGVSFSSFADVQPLTWSGVPAQVIPQALERGAPTFSTPSGSSSFVGHTGTGSNTGAGSSTAYTGSGTSYDEMIDQSYGQIAASTAQQLGINPNAIAGIGHLESGFQNLATANGSSSAMGPWQITSSTWSDYVSKYNLAYTAADRTNPDAQAVVSNYVLKDYAATVSAAIQQPATVEQAYGAYVFGPSAGTGMAGASANEPMSIYVSAKALANNNMTGWTIGQFQQRVNSKIGNVATQTVAL